MPMGYNAKILRDSVSPLGIRLTTFEVTFPRIVLAEFNTHRVFARNSASSRAIPVEKMIKRVMEDPYVPESWGKNQKGMQSGEPLGTEASRNATKCWLWARDEAVAQARAMLELGVHKQLTNRLLEPWLWHTVIVTATEWSNFFNLRAHPDAHPAIRKPAEAMLELYDSHEASEVGSGEWHLPLVESDEANNLFIQGIDPIKVSVGRCARVSYLTHDGVRDPSKDLELYERLLKSGHMSPFEHVATPAPGRGNGWETKWSGPFYGWIQHRKQILHEDDMLSEANARWDEALGLGKNQ